MRSVPRGHTRMLTLLSQFLLSLGRLQTTWRTPCWPMPHSHARRTSGSCNLRQSFRIHDPWDSRNVQLLATPRQPHLPPRLGPPVCSDSHARFSTVHRQMLSSSISSRPLRDSVIFSLALRGRNLGVKASISRYQSGLWGIWYGDLAARAPTHVNNGIKFKFFSFLKHFFSVCMCPHVEVR